MAFPADLNPERVILENSNAWMLDYVQGSQEWLDARKMAVGGSVVHALLGKSAYNTRYSAIASMIASESIEMNVPIVRGLLGEKYIRDYLSEQLGMNIREIGMGVKKDAPWMRASPDGIYDLGNGDIGIVEIKIISSRHRTLPYYNICVALQDDNSDVNALVHDEHWNQVHYTAGVLGAKEITYCVLCWKFDGSGTGVQPGFIYCARFKPDEKLFQNLHVPVAKLAYELACARK
jgi:hypothetical protein